MPLRSSPQALTAWCTVWLTLFATALTAPAQATPSEHSMIPTALTRIVDTRAAVGLPDQLPDNHVTEIQVTGEIPTIAGNVQKTGNVVPANAQAVVLNITAVSATHPGYFVLWKHNTPRPQTSNINYATGTTVANGATIPLSAEGKVSIFSRGSAHLLIDVAGYFTDGEYSEMAPERLHDSRILANAKHSERSATRIRVSQNGPGETNGGEGDLVTLNVTVTEPEAAGFVTVWPTQDDMSASTAPPVSLLGMPQTSNLNYVVGQTVANTVTVTAGKGGYVTIYTMGAAHLVVDKMHHIDDADVSKYAVMLDSARRVMDSREGLGSTAKTGFRKLDLLSHSTGNLDGFGSAIINVTVDNPQAAGFVSVGPDIEKTGANTSILNFSTGQTIANHVIIPVSALGTVHVYSNVLTDVIIDLAGYTITPKAPHEPLNVDLSQLPGRAVFTAQATDNSGQVLPIGGNDVLIFHPATVPAGYELAGPEVLIRSQADEKIAQTVTLTSTSNMGIMRFKNLPPGAYTAVFTLKNSVSPSSVPTYLEVDFGVTSTSASNSGGGKIVSTVDARARLDYRAGLDTKRTHNPNEVWSFTVSADGNTDTILLDEYYESGIDVLKAYNDQLLTTGVVASFENAESVITLTKSGSTISVAGTRPESFHSAEASRSGTDSIKGNVDVFGYRDHNPDFDYQSDGVPNAPRSITVTPFNANPVELNFADRFYTSYRRDDQNKKIDFINAALAGTTVTASFEGSSLVFEDSRGVAPTVSGPDAATEFGIGVNGTRKLLIPRAPTDATVYYKLADEVAPQWQQDIAVAVPAEGKDGTGTVQFFIQDDAFAGGALTPGPKDTHILRLPTREELLIGNLRQGRALPKLIRVQIQQSDSDSKFDRWDDRVSPEAQPGTDGHLDTTADGFRQGPVDGNRQTGRVLEFSIRLG